MTTNYAEVIRSLVNSSVEFIIVGGAAANVHGSSRLTEDLDIVYSRSRTNIEHLVSALAPYHPYLRGVPPGLPFKWSVQTVENGLNFTLSLDIGALDLFGEIIGGNYESLINDSEQIQLFGLNCSCLSLEQLIKVKRAAGRPKDFESLAELESILEERRKIKPNLNTD